VTADLPLAVPATAGAFLLAVDTMDLTLGVMEAGFFVNPGLSFFGSSTGTGGLFVGVGPPAMMLLFVDPVDPFLARTPSPAPPTAPGRVGVTRPDEPPRDARALLTFETVEFDDVVRDLRPVPAPMEELAVRNVSPPVEMLIFEVGREEARDDTVEVRGVAPRVLGDVAVLLRIVDV
jgi:hypothetical protein